ncbi:LOW QUALITY PROTEIN: hypothetical protein QTO34_014997 [Cnephaeus nilssonii]|uniref:Integrase catalytic domain-containing protein n=1 Tax=Cnephaeus nilssonii TaxID=3371016 RepID=A0AA40HAU6_CNENI|nr:LOW QUALITY PROTEIN: hypothetical protein QTO34_014997 [Eptesicus nilssonii]
MALQLPDPGDQVLPVQPGYSLEELQRIRKLPQAQEEKGWWYTPQGELILPDQLGVSMINHMHRCTHLGARKLKDLIRHERIKIHQQDIKIEPVNSQMQEPGRVKKEPGSEEPSLEHNGRSTSLRLNQENTFSRRVEAYPTKHETAQTVAKKLLEDILPRYSFPTEIGSNNGPAFVSQVTQAVAKAIGANWKLHCAYRPQSSGQVERINRTLKETLTKLTMETGGDCGSPSICPLPGTPPTPWVLLLMRSCSAGHPLLSLTLKLNFLQNLKVKNCFFPWEGSRGHTRTFGHASHKPGDWVYVKRHRRETLEPRWKGSYVVVLMTPTALKVDGVTTWVHHTHVRPADPSAIWEDFIAQWSITRDQCNPIKLKLRCSQPA